MLSASNLAAVCLRALGNLATIYLQAGRSLVPLRPPCGGSVPAIRRPSGSSQAAASQQSNLGGGLMPLRMEVATLCWQPGCKNGHNLAADCLQIGCGHKLLSRFTLATQCHLLALLVAEQPATCNRRGCWLAPVCLYLSESGAAV